MLARPFLDSLLSPIWNWAVHLALSEAAVRDAQFVVETLRLSWRPCVMGEGDLARALSDPTRQPHRPVSKEGGKAAQDFPAWPAEETDRTCVSMRPGPGTVGICWVNEGTLRPEAPVAAPSSPQLLPSSAGTHTAD